MHVLAFRHVPFEDVGHIRPVLESCGIEVRSVDLYRGGAMPDPADAAGLIFMGGPMSVNDDLPYLCREMELISTAASRNQPVFGVCLGSQLIAKALGARVRPNSRKEIGWFEVQLTPAAGVDPVFGGMPTSQTIFQWHGETFDLPAGATLLATSKLCRHQAFTVNGGIYAIQFHPEVTPEMIADWCRQDANCGDLREVSTPIDPTLHAESQAALSKVIFSRWAELL
jgi:GMP synthase (glutamine-hydrolysing)